MEAILDTTTSEAYKNFINSLDSEASRIGYRKSFPAFMRFCKVETYDGMLGIEPKRLEGLIRDYIIHLREDRKVSPATISNYCAAIAHFFEMNDVAINWKKLKKFKGRLRRVIEDLPYTHDQIKSMLARAGLRDRCIILLMASAGLRRGALPSLRIKDLQRIERYDLYKVTVYKREQEQYISYCTPECARHIDEYLEWRARLGEKIQSETVLFRKEFASSSHMRIAKPKPISADAIGYNMSELLDKTGIRPRMHMENKKSNLMQCHGFRKFFDTQCINHGMNPIYCEYLMGHKSGLLKSYFKPTDLELLEGNDKSLGYTAMIPYLTINATEEENQRLKQELVKREVQHSQEWELMRQQITEMKEKLNL